MPARSLVVARPWGTRGLRKAGAPNAKRTVRARAADGAQVADGSVVQLASPEDFEKVVAEATAQNKLLCTMVSTRTCGPCKLVYPKFVKLADAYDGVVFAKIMGDASAETRVMMKEWGVRAVPQFRFVVKGEVTETFTGSNAEGLEEVLKEQQAACV